MVDWLGRRKRRRPTLTYVSPGAFLEESARDRETVSGAPTAVVAFIGSTQIGPFDAPTPLTSWVEFESTFGNFSEDSYLAHAVYGFFENGGGVCYVVRVGAGRADSAGDQRVVQTASNLGPADFIGSADVGTGLASLEVIEVVTMICAPDLMMAYQRGWIDLDGILLVQRAIIEHCERNGNRIAILDPPPDLDAEQILRWRVDTAMYDSSFATLHWPWIKVDMRCDAPTSKMSFIPPSGHIAGIWTRCDAERGVWKAPANQLVRGALALETTITGDDQVLLKPVGINCIRAFGTRGILVWGARTLSSESTWRYINVRRLINYLAQSIADGTNWMVSEPDDPAVMEKAREQVERFLVGVWRNGALFGTTSDEAFSVTCNDSSHDSSENAARSFTFDIAVAAVPAEFIRFRVAQALPVP